MAFIDDLLARGEKVVYVGRQHTFVLVSNILTELILVAILIAAGIASKAAFADQRVLMGQPVGTLVMLVCLLISVLIVISAFMDYFRWNNEQYVVTDQRVLQIRGIFNKSVGDSSLEKINDVLLTQSWLGRLFDFGNIEIITGSDIGVNHLRSLAHPLEFKRAMMEAKQHYSHGFGYLDPQALAAYVDAQRESVSAPPETIEQTLRRLATMREQGLLSQEEFDAKRQEVLSRI